MEIGNVDPQNDANPHTKRKDDRKDLDIDKREQMRRIKGCLPISILDSRFIVVRHVRTKQRQVGS